MASRVVMPKLSDTMEEGRILRWLRKEGDQIETGQALAEVETDKATVEMEAYTTGTVRKVIAPEGSTIQVGQLIAIIGAPDEDISALIAQQAGPEAGESRPAPPHAAATPAPGTPGTAQAAPAPPPAAPARPEPAPQAPGQARGPAGGRGGHTLRASPLALRMAAEAGVDLSEIQGTGPQGRVIKRDVEAAAQRARQAEAPAARPAAWAAAEGGAEFEEVGLSQIRRTIARRLVQSKAPVPHFYLTVEIAMDRAWEAYRALRDAEHSTITINDIVVKACASALGRHPELNASFAGDHVKIYSHVHIGLAVALDDGLITPVIRDADRKTLEDISVEARALAERARARRLQPHEYTGATFSISNLGMMGIEEFAAIINPPEAAILAVGSVRETPVVEHGAITIGHRMKVTLSVDHRVADGAMGARFLQTLKRLLENPLLIG